MAEQIFLQISFVSLFDLSNQDKKEKRVGPTRHKKGDKRRFTSRELVRRRLLQKKEKINFFLFREKKDSSPTFFPSPDWKESSVIICQDSACFSGQSKKKVQIAPLVKGSPGQENKH